MTWFAIIEKENRTFASRISLQLHENRKTADAFGKIQYYKTCVSCEEKNTRTMWVYIMHTASLFSDILQTDRQRKMIGRLAWKKRSDGCKPSRAPVWPPGGCLITFNWLHRKINGRVLSHGLLASIRVIFVADMLQPGIIITMWIVYITKNQIFFLILAIIFSQKKIMSRIFSRDISSLRYNICDEVSVLVAHRIFLNDIKYVWKHYPEKWFFAEKILELFLESFNKSPPRI